MQLSKPSITLENDSLRLIILPGVGGSFKYFGAKVSTGWIELMRHTPDSYGSSSDSSNFLMAPYPNRIRDGVFDFEGKRYSLKFPEKHAIHGDVRNRDWEVIASSADSCTLQFNSKGYADINYPFPFDLSVSHKLSHQTLRTELTLTNSGKTDMTAGAGFHPYFPRALKGDLEEVKLQFKVSAEYPFEGTLPLPTGSAIPLPKEHDFSNFRKIGGDFDHCFSGWDGVAEISWPSSGVTLSMRASENCRHLVLYSPPGKDFFALEPQTQMNDGFNFPDSDSGVTVLTPGESLNMIVEFTLKG